MSRGLLRCVASKLDTILVLIGEPGSRFRNQCYAHRYANREARSPHLPGRTLADPKCRANGTQRAWQQLPRHLRRRAASHDVRRVPLRLRDKAKAEVRPRPTVSCTVLTLPLDGPAEG